MSELKANKISPSSGTTLTLADASDTITLATGVTLNVVDGVPVASGGTALTSFTAGDVLYATGTTTLAKLANGTAAQLLSMNSGATAPEWATAAATAGGTGQTGFTAGDILYANSTTTLTKLGKGTGLQGLQTNSGATAPEWADSPQSLMTAEGDVLYASGANTLAKLAKGSDDDVLTLASGVPSWAAPSSGFTASAVTATTSGTDIAFTSIPAGTKVIYINFNRVSLSGTDDFVIQLGDSGGVETSGYYNYSGRLNDNVLLVAANSTAGLWLPQGAATYGLNGTVTCTLVDGTNHIWSMTASTCNVAIGGDDSTQYLPIGQCQKDLSAELDRINISTDGSDTFDNGSISLLYM